MGIKNLMKIIKKYASSSIKNVKITHYKNKLLAIDTNLMIYKSVYAVRKNGYDLKNEDMTITHIHTMLAKIMGFIKYNIYPIFIFDNKPSYLKHNTIEKRNIFQKELKHKYEQASSEDEKKKYYYMYSGITSSDIKDCKELINIFGFPVIDAPEEADTECVGLVMQNLADGIISDDLDILIFGGNKLIKNFSVSEKQSFQQIKLKKVLKKLKLTYPQLVDLAILLGCDYCSKNKSLGPISAYKKILEYQNINNLIEKKIIEPIDNYNEIAKYFVNPVYAKHVKNEFEKKSIDFDKLISFLNKYKFKKEYTDKILAKLKYSP